MPGLTVRGILEPLAPWQRVEVVWVIYIICCWTREQKSPWRPLSRKLFGFPLLSGGKSEHGGIQLSISLSASPCILEGLFRFLRQKSALCFKHRTKKITTHTWPKHTDLEQCYVRRYQALIIVARKTCGEGEKWEQATEKSLVFCYQTGVQFSHGRS